MILENRVAIITGAAMGLGRAIALTMAEEGAEVVIADVNESALKDTAREIEAIGQRVLATVTDVTSKEQAQRMVQRAVAAFGRVDILVNNAGGALHTPHRIEDVEVEDWDKVVNVNLR